MLSNMDSASLVKVFLIYLPRKKLFKICGWLHFQSVYHWKHPAVNLHPQPAHWWLHPPYSSLQVTWHLLQEDVWKWVPWICIQWCISSLGTSRRIIFLKPAVSDSFFLNQSAFYKATNVFKNIVTIQMK